MKAACRKASQALISSNVTGITDSVGIRRTRHAVYDLKYHLVWIPKYRKPIFSKEVGEYIKEVLRHIAEEYGFHHGSTGRPCAHICRSTSEIFSGRNSSNNEEHLGERGIQKYSKPRKQLWAGELWNDGYFVRSVGDKVTADVIRHYIEY